MEVNITLHIIFSIPINYILYMPACEIVWNKNCSDLDRSKVEVGVKSDSFSTKRALFINEAFLKEPRGFSGQICVE